jgi:hypothetical protein
LERVYSVGLQATALQKLLPDGPSKDKAAAVVEELDSLIRDIREDVSA